MSYNLLTNNTLYQSECCQQQHESNITKGSTCHSIDVDQSCEIHVYYLRLSYGGVCSFYNFANSGTMSVFYFISMLTLLIVDLYEHASHGMPLLLFPILGRYVWVTVLYHHAILEVILLTKLQNDNHNSTNTAKFAFWTWETPTVHI